MDKKRKPPAVRLAKPTGRPIQLRYTDPETGKEVRISTTTYDSETANIEKQKLEAKLLLGIDIKPKRRNVGGPSMDWQEFRERFDELHLSTLRDKSQEAVTVRLGVAERILKPARLSDVANSEALHELQSRLLAGDEGKWPRSPQTVKSYMVAVLSALNWANYMQWLPAVPKVRKVKVSKLRHMKGRPLVAEEFERLLAKVEIEVGTEAADSWRYSLRGLWESGLRLGELMHMHWSDSQYIIPTWQRGSLPVLAIPADMQKNATEESIPMLPGFEQLLLETPKSERFGWVFNPMSLQTKLGRRVRRQRSATEWIGRVITRIGEAAGIIVLPGQGERPAKYASAHDLRRSCAERLIAAGIPEREVARVMRHASVETTRRHYAPGNVQQAAGVIRGLLVGRTGIVHSIENLDQHAFDTCQPPQ